MCEEYIKQKITSKDISQRSAEFGRQVISLEDKELQDLVRSIPATFDILWYANGMDINETEEGDKEIRDDILRYVYDIEKLIIRGNADGEPVTESERAEWWKKQKEKEREEFYNLNGYYEDDDSSAA